jgi:hypothetical protein
MGEVACGGREETAEVGGGGMEVGDGEEAGGEREFGEAVDGEGRGGPA